MIRAIAAGETLIKVKAEIPRGQRIAFLNACELPYRTAATWVSLAENKDHIDLKQITTVNAARELIHGLMNQEVLVNFIDEEVPLTAKTTPCRTCGDFEAIYREEGLCTECYVAEKREKEAVAEARAEEQRKAKVAKLAKAAAIAKAKAEKDAALEKRKAEVAEGKAPKEPKAPKPAPCVVITWNFSLGLNLDPMELSSDAGDPSEEAITESLVKRLIATDIRDGMTVRQIAAALVRLVDAHRGRKRRVS